MTRLATFGAVLPLLAAGVLGCSDNNDPGEPTKFRKFEYLCDFEAGSIALVKDDRWGGAWEKGNDTSPGRAQIWGPVDVFAPERINPSVDGVTPGLVSSHALHVTDFGDHTQWGSTWLVTLNNFRPVDLSQYTGISFWAKSDNYPPSVVNFPPPIVKFALPDLGSYPSAIDPITMLPPEKDPITGQPRPMCDPIDTKVGGRGCYDDYSIRIYPDGKWRRYDIPFSSLTTGGWGLIHPFDPTHIYSIKFSMLAGASYSVWTDDFAVYLK